eukprot:Plantae.Rhodophyta-Purpureofilum_apyrenoidigerum.ctg1483.p1 GENE.Plantae.Rhodophyta-Purpureofilum_apyrenoidigerum.ctg1483~~Plantae.Rhodophyta-Purpureofilum_apyrenoidigerum.ctg1483.p1  ORF type:complete len:175 (-),score=40.64 Plantae.Rhodophyta-Purpureofilum_apyrenoidigerum.ctg1483:335-859(-)
MAKGLRSKVKRAYRALKREKMVGVYKKKLEATVLPLHEKAGFVQEEMMEVKSEEQKVVKHAGVELGTNFVPDHPRPKLNVVHGPLAENDESDIDQVVSFVSTEHRAAASQDRKTTDEAKTVKSVDDAAMEDTTIDLRHSKAIGKHRSRKRKNAVSGKIRKSARHPQNKARRNLF